MTMATQFATTKVGYSYSIVHPSNADIRYIGSDNSTDGRLLRVDGTNGTNMESLTMSFGNWGADTNKTYSASFAIVNEEYIPVKIMYINVSNTTGKNYLQIWLHGDRDKKVGDDGGSPVFMYNNGTIVNGASFAIVNEEYIPVKIMHINVSNITGKNYLQIWLHGDRDKKVGDDTGETAPVLMYNNGTIVNATSTVAWTLAGGNQDASDMSNGTFTDIPTLWDNTKGVRYSLNDSNAESSTADFVWVQISLNIPRHPDQASTHDGIIWIHFEADSS